MMDHYEELGVSRCASPDEIRLAYKRLARLLHPDRCRDVAVRRLAEIQMQRLNAVLALLTSSEEREAYDRRLEFGPDCRSGQPPRRRLPQWLWPAASALLFTAALSVFLNVPRPAVVAPIAAATLPEYRPDPPKPAKRTARTHPEPAKPPSPHRTAAADAPAKLAGAQLADLDAAPQATDPVTEAPPSPRPAQTESVPKPAGPPPADPVPASDMAGEWLFAPAPGSRTPGLYPAEYIELRITEEAGMLHGRYRGRYQVNDRAISPNVTLQFEGHASAREVTLPWTGAGGSAGEITLRLLPNGALQVSWLANHITKELGLVSGTATLLRKLE